MAPCLLPTFVYYTLFVAPTAGRHLQSIQQALVQGELYNVRCGRARDTPRVGWRSRAVTWCLLEGYSDPGGSVPDH